MLGLRTKMIDSLRKLLVFIKYWFSPYIFIDYEYKRDAWAIYKGMERYLDMTDELIGGK